jgi:glycosyltransferase involved in cell wall biosynthesis
LQGCLVYWFNRFTRGLLLRKASGFIFPSHELAETQFNAVYQKPARVISNGIDLMKNPPLPPAANSHPVITLVGSPGMKWHGVDKIVKLAERFPDLNFNIVGYQISDIGSSIPPNIRVLGFLSREEVRQVLRETDVACGTLALHRKGMNEASPLKVREAVSCGLPVILGYYDTDLSNLAGEYILHLPNTEDNVESCAEQIHSFAYRMMGKRMDQRSVRERIDQQRKELARIDFLIEIFRQFHTRNNG